MRWRIGILYRSIELLGLLSQKPRAEAEMLQSFSDSRFRNVAISDILETCLFAEWAERDGRNVIRCTDAGHRLLRLGHTEEKLRAQIQTLLSKEEPLWASSAVQGRNALANYAPPEAVQCFREAGLLDGDDEDTVIWWDTLACRYRAARDDAYVQIGRIGERLTVDLERQRTGTKPRWVALEYSRAGYDVVSRVDSGDPSPFVIEVKTSTQPWPLADFFLSRAEWDVLNRQPHAAIHLWSVVNGKSTDYASISMAELEMHVPSDSGDGCWHRCRIPFTSFAPCRISSTC